MIISSFALLAIALYLGATIALARPLLSGRAPLHGLAQVLAGAAILVHAGILLGIHRGELDLHFYAALSLVACVVSILTVLINLSRSVAALGVVTFSLSAIFLAVDAFLAPPTIPRGMDWQISLHVAIGLSAFSALSIASILAILLAIQERALRHRQFGQWMRVLPPLTLTETWMFRLIGIGFALLSLTLLTGLLFVGNLFGQHLIHKTVLSIIAWVVFGVLLFGRWRQGWRGRSAVNLTLIGMGVLLLAFFGTKAVLELILHRTL
ncbi:MAG: cytochrome c biogenesis protein CcsA [Dyella sp.]